MPLGGAEMPAGKLVEAFYDGTEFVLLTDYTGGAPVGSETIAAYGTADPGYVLEYGQCLTTMTISALAAKLGTTYNSQDGCAAGQTGLPDRRGRTVFGLDNMGGTAANRITAAGGNFAGTTLGAAGGQQNKVIAQANIPSYTLSGSGSGSISGSASGSMSGSGSSQNGPAASGPQSGNGAGSDLQCCLWPGPVPAGTPVTSSVSVSGTLSVSGSASTSDTISSGGSGAALATLSNGQIAIYEIKL